MKIKAIIALFLALMTGVAANAAGVKISGKITDENNEALEFVSVRIAGTAIGAVSGLDGTYSLSAPEADTIRITFTLIGYQDSRRTLIKPKGGGDGEREDGAAPL